MQHYYRMFWVNFVWKVGFLQHYSS
jgi:hypothetical protein